MKATVYSIETPEAREQAITAAQNAIRDSKTIVLPTDTVYGIGADAFSHEGVSALLAAKGRSRTMPPPVLIFDEAVLPGLADEVSEDATALARQFWPGALTLILYSQPSLSWDLGETQGTVALRVPNDPLAIDLLRQIGPLAVSSANKTGQQAATNAEDAAQQLGEDVELIIDGGPRRADSEGAVDPASVLPSTIVDCTSDRLVVVREGAISLDELRAVVPTIVTKAELEAGQQGAPMERARGRRFADESAALVSADSAQNSEGRRFAEEMVSNPQPAQSPGLGNGPRAAEPVQGSLHSTLVNQATSAQGVDQMRTKEKHRQDLAKKKASILPLSQQEAQNLLFDPEQ